jgi:hypothetical protein
MKISYMFGAVLLAVSSLSFAQTSVTVQHGQQESSTTGAQSHTGNFFVTSKISDSVALDGGIYNTVADSARTTGSRYEVGATAFYPVNSVLTASVRAGTGLKQPSGADHSYYYSVEPAVTAKFGSVGARVGYRYRDAFSDTVADQSRTVRYAVFYDMTAKDRITLGYDDWKGDGASKTTYLGYTRSF